jgi:hypothetical protein
MHTPASSDTVVKGPKGTPIRIFERGYGCHHTLICGGEYGQRDKVVAAFATSVAATGAPVWLVDFYGKSALKETPADMVAKNPRQAADMVRLLRSNVEFRLSLQDHPYDSFLVLVLAQADEALLDPETAKAVAHIAKYGRRAGVSLLLSSSDGSRAALGGGTGASIRENVSSANLITL